MGHGMSYQARWDTRRSPIWRYHCWSGFLVRYRFSKCCLAKIEPSDVAGEYKCECGRVVNMDVEETYVPEGCLWATEGVLWATSGDVGGG